MLEKHKLHTLQVFLWVNDVYAISTLNSPFRNIPYPLSKMRSDCTHKWYKKCSWGTLHVLLINTLIILPQDVILNSICCLLSLIWCFPIVKLISYHLFLINSVHWIILGTPSRDFPTFFLFTYNLSLNLSCKPHRT